MFEMAYEPRYFGIRRKKWQMRDDAMATSLDNALAAETPWLRTNYLVKTAPGQWQVTFEVLKKMGGDSAWHLHIYHLLRDWLKPNQVILIDKDCDSCKFFMVKIDLNIEGAMTYEGYSKGFGKP